MGTKPKSQGVKGSGTTSALKINAPTMGTMSEKDMELYDLRIVVDRIEGRSVCQLKVGDYFEMVNSSEVRIPEGKHFCFYAMQAVAALLPAKQRQLPEGDWLERDNLVSCPDPEERLIMRIERIRKVELDSEKLT